MDSDESVPSNITGQSTTQTANKAGKKPPTCLRNMMNQSRARAIKLQQDFQKVSQKTEK